MREVANFLRETLEKKKGRVCDLDFMVPGDRVELPTRGFSVPCSTD